MLREELFDAGIDLSAQSNALASIHSVIRRLVDSGEIERYGKTDLGAYRWKQTDEIEDSLKGALSSDHPARKLAKDMRLPKAPIPPASMRKKLGL
jgi:hypothetical protein